MSNFFNRRNVWVSLIVIGVVAGMLWPNSPPPKAKDLLPLLQELDEQMKAHGKYPTNYEDIKSLAALAKRHSVYTGFRNLETMEITWSPHEVSAHDFAVMTQASEFQIFVPSGRIKIYSFSSFPVWKYESSTRKWREGRIHWSILGAYWSED